jgi:membrane peptidoglycan carboxypeptidase
MKPNKNPDGDAGSLAKEFVIRWRRRGDAAETRSSRLPAWLRFSRWPKWLRVCSIISAVLWIAGICVLLGVSAKYSRLAAEYDLDTVEKLEEGSLVLDAKGESVGRIFIEDRLFVSLSEVPQHLINAILATEDSRFYSHNGFDGKGMLRAAFRNLKEMRIAQGASTITQQLARHAYRLRGRTFDRKLTEVFLAIRLEERFSKAEILESYMNRIYLGSGYYGVGSAARGYFGKKVGDLSIAEAATIAGIIKSPSAFSPYVASKKAEYVRNLTLSRLLDLDKISNAEFARAKRSPVTVVNEHMRDARPFYAMEAVRREVESSLPSWQDHDRSQITTTLDMKVVEKTIEVIQGNLAEIESRYPELAKGGRLEAAVVVLDNRSGKILAAVGGRDYRKSPFDRAFHSVRPPGTAFLPFTYAASFASGKSASLQTLLDAPLDNAKVMIGGQKGTLAEWGGGDATFYEGDILSAYAFLKSKTNSAVRAGNKAGVAALAEMVRNAGITTPLRPYPSSFLGTSEVRLIDLTRAYTAIANRGVPCPPPYLVEQVSSADGQIRQLGSPSDGQSIIAIPPEAAEAVREVMTARLRAPQFDSILDEYRISGRGLAGQSGSAYGFTDAWFLGFDSNITCGVWVGHSDGRALPVTDAGRRMAMPIWAAIMAGATGGKPEGWPISFADASAGECLCLVSGGIATADCERDETGGYVRAAAFISGDPARLGKCTVHGESLRQRKIPRAIPVASPRIFIPQAVVVPMEPPIRGLDPYAARD